MSWPTLRFQNQLPPSVKRELESLIQQLTQYLATGHDSDGNNLGSSSAGSVTGPTVSVDGEVVLFDGTTGQVIKRLTGTGLVHATAGVASVGTAAYADIQHVSATSRFLGRKSSGAGVIEELSVADALTLLGFINAGAAFYTGSGHPQRILSAPIGNVYQDTATGYLYRKVGGGSTAYGWYPWLTSGLTEGPVEWRATQSDNTSNNVFGASIQHGPLALHPALGTEHFTQTVSGSATKQMIGGKQFASGATSGTAASIALLNSASANQAKLIDDDVDLWATVNTDPTAVTATRIWFGWCNAAMTDTISAPAYTGALQAMLIRYLSDGNGVWEGFTSAGGSGAGTRNNTTTLGTPAAATTYKLRIRFVRSGTPTVYFSVNDGTEVSLTSTIPATGQTPFLQLGIDQPSGSTAKAIRWRAMGGSFGS